MAFATDPSAPPTAVPASGVHIGPVAFLSDRGPASGSRRTVFIDDPTPDAITITGEFYPPARLTAYCIGQLVLSVAGAAALFGALIVASGAEGDAVSPLSVALSAAGIAAVIASLIWKAILVHSTRAATLDVPVGDIARVRTTVNRRLLAWWLLIGPFALIPVFAGRRLLRIDVPVAVDGRTGMLRLVLREQRHGDADLIATRLRLACSRIGGGGW